MKRIVIAGASGTIGLAALRVFAADPDWDVIGLSRRAASDTGKARLLHLDLLDRAVCATAMTELGGVTHLVYTALTEKPGLVEGWHDHELMATNLRMFRHVLDPLIEAGTLEHVSLLQGAKAYGVHVEPVPIPARERSPRHRHDNFYFLQEDYLRQRQEGAAWTWTILRPQVVYGESLGSPMNLIPALGAYGALLKEAGLPLSFPGGAARVSEAVDTDLVADALRWAAVDPAARNEIFNLTNGDVLVWPDVWPVIAESLGMDVGPARPRSLAAEMPGWQESWTAIVDRHQLVAPRRLEDFVGQSFVYADMLLGYRAASPAVPALLSTIKIRQAGFSECVDTEDMFRKWFARLQNKRLLPPPTP